MQDPKIPCDHVRVVPDGDQRERVVCQNCGHIYYDNPKIVAGAICVWDDRYLLCRRNIEPRKGFWTMPAGFLELGETPEMGAKREVWEEAQAKIEIETLLGCYHRTDLSQVYLIFLARMMEPGFKAGPESQEVRLFSWDELPWEDLAFPNVAWALRDHHELRGKASFETRTNPDGASGSVFTQAPVHG